MSEEASIQRFYKHTNSKEEIGWKHGDDRRTIGPNLEGVFKVLGSQGLSERGSVYQQEGGWSGDLYVVHRRLFQFQNEVCRFMGDSGTGGPLRANVQDVTLNSTGGWAQYLSVILKGEHDEAVAQELADLDFAPKHSYLAKGDIVPKTSGHPGNLWLDDFIEVGFPRHQLTD